MTTSTTAIHQNYIGGRWIPSSSGRVCENRNPANHDDLIGLFPDSTIEDATAAIVAARVAFDGWRLTPAPKRAEILFRAAQLIVDNKETFAKDMTREMGKVLEEARGDVQEAIDMTYFLAAEGRRMYGQTVPSELPDKFAMSVRQPVGVCSIITPWNFPMAIPSWKIVPALVCGNTVVFKPSELTPLSAGNFVRVLEQAGVPPGVLNMVTGGPAIGELLTTHKDIAVVSFTGSTAVGRLVNQNAAPYFKKVHLEMGGKNCIMVMDDANLELALEGALWGGFGTTGQRCTAASRLIVHEDVHDRFVAEFVRRVQALRVGDGLDRATMVGPSISDKQLAKVKSYVEIGKEEGATVASGGRQLTEGVFSKGHFYEPTVFVDVQPTMRIAREEIFGPVVTVRKCRSLDEAIAIANDVEYGLSASVYTQDINRAFRAMREVYTGIFYVNAPTIGAEVHLPFGGTKATGNGHREAGTAALDVFSEWKSIYVDFSGKLQRAQIDNN
jgi:alpha-ketoglutaric semialdehyde dehydrogenase